MEDEQPVAVVAAPEGSVAKGMIAGLGATVAGVPLLGISFFIALFVRRSILSRLMGREIESEEIANEHSTGFFADVVLAAATGLIGAALATVVVLLFVKNVRRSTFMAVGTAGFTAIAAAAWLWASHRYPGSGTSQGMYIGIGWLGAVLGLYIGAMINAEGALEAETPPVAE